MRNIFKKRKSVTLVLGGGSARGLAHIGVLKILEREKIPIDRVVGTSMGSIIGAGYAVGIPIEDMEEKAVKFSTNRLLDPIIPAMGLLAGDKMERMIRRVIDNRNFSDCRIPLTVVATNIETGEDAIFQHGDLVRVVRASSSWPGIFNPVKIDGKILVDGGLTNSVPTKIAKSLYPNDYIIAVDVGFCIKKGKLDNIFQMILQSFQITGEELNKYQGYVADTIIKVDLGDIDQVAFERAREAIEKGAQTALMAIGKIKKNLGI